MALPQLLSPSPNDRKPLVVVVPEPEPHSEPLERPAGVTKQIVWRYAVPIFGLHLMACACFVPWLFSWTGLALCLVGTYVYGGLGINLGYHRLLCHRSFKCPRWLERTFVVIALCCLEDAPASWVATHRLHHNDADTKPDPHTPLVSFLWSHVGWLLLENKQVHSLCVYDRYARDVLHDRFYMWLQRGMTPVWIYLAHAAIYFAAGLSAGWYLTGSGVAALQFGLSVVAWGVILRTVFVWHISWSVNSLTHLFGYRNFETDENSRNNWLVALLSNGEGWHNNHHGDPASASNRNRWWEIDVIYLVIRSLECVGLVTDVIRPRHYRR